MLLVPWSYNYSGGKVRCISLLFSSLSETRMLHRGILSHIYKRHGCLTRSISQTAPFRMFTITLVQMSKICKTTLLLSCWHQFLDKRSIHARAACFILFAEQKQDTYQLTNMPGDQLVVVDASKTPATDLK